jgi:DNA-directed RNA polymerase subunit beta
MKLIERMILINNGHAGADDIDHLGNRRVKTVGELIQNKLRIGLRRTERVVKERMSIRELENLTPVTLVNIRPVVAAIREFFGSSQLSQFMEQTNPLAELTHKRTLSALGPGGLRRERAGFDVRDVHHSHYGRICPIETPEGPNIGLIGRLASYGRVNEYGFIETPYREVVKFMEPDNPDIIGRTIREDVEISEGKTIASDGDVIDRELAQKLAKAGIEKVPVMPFVSSKTVYLSADSEDHFIVAQANAPLDELQQFANDRISVRYNQKFMVMSSRRVDYMDVAPRQIVGISAALIPFLEHDDANRALMGSNMQRQAVPLLKPDVPIVSTGMESQAAYDSGQVLVADRNGEVISVQGDRIIIRDDKGDEHIYRLRKYNRSNQSTCIDQRPIVNKGQFIRKGEIIADSSSTTYGYIALGHDVLGAFLSWDGGNYEDALLISEELLRQDKFTSIHIEKHEIEARDTKLGPEEITYDIPNVGEDALKDLDEFGIVRIGAEVGPNDILVGKITPKGEKELSPEEKLLRAIFGEQAREVKDSSLRLPHGEKGKVVDVKTFTREEHPDLPAGVEKMVRVSVAQKRKLTIGDKMAGRHGNKGVISKIVPIEDMPYLADGRPVEIILNPLGVPGRMNIGQVLEIHLGWAADRLGFRAVTPVFDGAKEDEIRAELGRAWMIERAWKEMTERAWQWIQPFNYDPEELEDEAEVRRLFINDWLGQNTQYEAEHLLTDEVYARRSVLREWLREKGFVPDDILAFDTENLALPERRHRDEMAMDVSLRLWIQWASPETDVPADLKGDALQRLADRAMFESGQPLPIYGKHILYDGRTGEPFDRPVTVGIIHMLKLAHLVEDKVHARSTGPYSLVTQQPLGGKAQFGGQRFGEMEVWALEAYGAAYTLQEMLTVKSDDVQGRVKTYEAIVKGEPIEEPGIPTSFRVLVKELQSLGLAVEAVGESGDIIRFGKDEEKARKPPMTTGLLSLAGDNDAL